MTSVNVTTTKNTVTVNGETRVVTVKTAGPQGTFTDGNLGDVTVSSNGTAIAINTGAVTSSKILDGTIVNADINASASIDGTKISPNFGSQNISTSGGITTNGILTIQSSFPRISLVDSDNDSDYDIRNSNGGFVITDQTNTQRRFLLNSTGGFQFGNGSAASDVDITGNLTIAGTVDGVDLSTYQADGGSYLRSDADDSFTGTLTGVSDTVNPVIQINGSGPNIIRFDRNTGDTSDSIDLIYRTSPNTLGFERVSDAQKMFTIDADDQQATFNGNVDCNAGLDVSGGDITGTLGSAVTGTTQSATDDSTKIATTAFVKTAVSNLVDSAPSTLDTLNELAAALGDDANFSTTVTNSIATKLPLAGGTLTGDLTIDKNNPVITFSDNNNPDYQVGNINGVLRFQDTTNNATRLQINTDGHIDLNSNVDVTGDISGTGDLFLTADTPKIRLIDNNADDDFQISNFSGNFIIKDITNNVDRFTIESDGTTTIANNLNVGAGIDVTGEITGTSHIDIPDDATLKLGDNDEFQIFHRGNDSVSLINEQGGGYLSFGSNGSRIEMYDIANARTMAKFNVGGSCEFKHAADIRLETSSTGISVTGEITGTSHLDLPDDAVLKLGDNDEFTIFHNSSTSHSVIKELGGGVLTLQTNGNHIDLTDLTNSVVMGQFTTGGACTFRHANDVRLATSSTGVDVTGNLTLPDNGQLQLGGATGGDFKIHHNGSHSIVHTQTGNLSLSSPNRVQLSNATGDGTGNYTNMLEAIAGGAVTLHYAGGTTPKLATNASGVVVNGELDINNTSYARTMYQVSGTNTWSVGLRDSAGGDTDYHIYRESGGGEVQIGAKINAGGGLDVTGSITIPDATITSGIPNNAIKIGDATNGDLMIYHDSNNSVIRDAGTGSLIFQSNQIVGYRYGTSEKLFQFDGLGAASLFHGGASTAKLATTATGISIDGSASISNAISLTAAQGDIEATGATGLNLNASNANAYARIRVAGATRLHIKNDGNIGIGNENPSSALDVTGDVVATGDGTFDDLRIGEWHGNASYGGVFHKNQDSSEYMMISNDGHTYLSATTGSAVIIRGGNNVSTNQITVSPTGGINLEAANNVNILDGILDFSAASSSPYIQMKAVSQRVKYLLWNHISFGIGMTAGVSYGSIGNNQNDNTQFAATFQMNDINDRGWIFLDSGHTLAQGAMSLTTQGRMTVAHSMRLGYGESDTTESGATHALDVSGSISSTSTISATTSAAIGDTNLRKITTSTSAPTSSDGGVGDIWIVYPS